MGSDMITTRLMQLDEVVERQEELTPIVQRAMDHSLGERSLPHIIQGIIDGEAQMWVVEDTDGLMAVCITEFMYFQQYKDLQIVALSNVQGKPWNFWGADAHETLETFAKLTGCKNIRIFGRKGWEKHLKTELPNYDHAYSVFVMEIN